MKPHPGEVLLRPLLGVPRWRSPPHGDVAAVVVLPDGVEVSRRSVPPRRCVASAAPASATPSTSREKDGHGHQGLMILGGAIVGGGEVYGVPEAGVGRAGPGRVGDGAGEES